MGAETTNSKKKRWFWQSKSYKEAKLLKKKTKIKRQPKAYIKEIKNLNRKQRKHDGKETLTNKPGNIIELIDVSKTYIANNEVNEILRNVSFEILEGEIVVLFGKSGSGKSTLLNLISGLDRPTEGQIIVQNQNLPYLSDKELTVFRRKNVSFIFQSYNLLQNISCYDNVEVGYYLQNDKSRKKDILELFKKFEIEHQMYKYPAQISGGQQQRVSIIRALAKNAPIVFADEPTAALDEKTSTIVLNTLLEMNKEFNTTIIIISHDSNVFNYVNKIVFVENQEVRVELVTSKSKKIKRKRQVNT